jgi:hypothetical protein
MLVGLPLTSHLIFIDRPSIHLPRHPAESKSSEAMKKVWKIAEDLIKWLLVGDANEPHVSSTLTPQEEEIRRIAISDFEEGRVEPPQRPGRLRDIYIKAQEIEEWASRQF